MTRTIGITLGEPHGIGPELTARALSLPQSVGVKFRIYGNAEILHFWLDRLRLTPVIPFELISCGPHLSVGASNSEMDRALSVVASLDMAASEAASQKIDALVTAPIDKSIVRKAVPDFTGHTEYLARRAGVPKTVMLLDNTEIRIVLLTEHIPLRAVPAAVTGELLQAVSRLVIREFKEKFGMNQLKIAVAGINPHAGEIVENSEEKNVLEPAIALLQKEGFLISGPFAADTIYTLAKSGAYDVVFSPYHDQGLVAAKYPGREKVVNITLGLPYLRVSPGHGVAYDIVGRKPASTGSFERALRIAIKGTLTQ